MAIIYRTVNFWFWNADFAFRTNKKNTVVPGFRVLGFSALLGFRALKAGNGAWSVHKTLFGFRAPLSQLLIKKILVFTAKESNFAP